jgi:hypothetical protein
MKNLLLSLSFLAFTFSSLDAQISYTDYGENGLRVSLNENLAIDLDQDGNVDYYINSHPNELGFTPIFAVGCFASSSESDYTSFDARRLSVYSLGDTISLNGSNFFDYIDDDRGSIYHDDGVFADQWEDGVAQYIGFALVNGLTKDGWMRIAIDQEANELVIYEIAYKEQISSTQNYNGIVAGETGVSSVADLGVDLSGFSIGPNPVSDYLKLDFSYIGDTPLSVQIVDATGKLLYRSFSTFNSGDHTLEIQTSEWVSGMYFLQLKNEHGLNTHKFNVSR